MAGQSMLSKLPFNLKNALLLLIGFLSLVLHDYFNPKIEGIFIGLISMYLFGQVQVYGWRRTFLIDRSQTNILFQHIKNGDIEEVKAIQKQFPKDQFLKLKPFGGYTMLIFAATEGHYDMVKYLVEQGANVNEESQNGETPLLRACYFNRPDVVKYLLQNKANIEHRSMQDLTPLLTAIMRNKPNIVKILLENGVKLQFKTKNQLAQEKFKSMSPEIVEIITEFQHLQRIKKFLRIKDQSKSFPKQMQNLNKNIMQKIIVEYI
eukprot:403337975